MSRIKISFFTIVLNGMPFMKPLLNSIYKYAHEIVIVEGAEMKCLFAANSDGSSTDGTVEAVKSFPDPENKIKLIQGIWNDKLEMENIALKNISADYVWEISSDEFYRDEDFLKVIRLLEGEPDITQIDFIPFNFWKGFDYIFYSPVFDQPVCHYRRVYKFEPGCYLADHRPPIMKYLSTSKSSMEIKHIDGFKTRNMDIRMYHYSYVYDDQVKQKIDLYNRYGWGKMWNLDMNLWYRDCYLRWTPENRKQVEASNPVWTGDKNSYTIKFNLEHPESVRELIQAEKSYQQQQKRSYELLTEKCGSLTSQISTLEAWENYILDEPLEYVRGLLKNNIQGKKNFWNLHVAIAYLTKTFKPNKYLEIGVRSGGSLTQVLFHGDPQLVVCVDLWNDNYASYHNTLESTREKINTYLRNLKKSPSIEFLKGDSHFILKELRKINAKFDMITVDGDHTQEGAFEDLVDAYHLLEEKGIIIFDDIAHSEYSVLFNVVNNFAKEYSLTVINNVFDAAGCSILLKNLQLQDILAKNIKIAGEYETGKSLTQIDSMSAFAQEIIKTIIETEPRKIIETGTYQGTGTTAIIAFALKKLNLRETKFFSIEVNKDNYTTAVENLKKRDIQNSVSLLHGLSIPRKMLPTIDEIERECVKQILYEDIFVDHKEEQRAELYFNETNYDNVDDDLLGKCLASFEYSPDFVLLDSGGHMGNIEFNYLLNKLKNECIIALDDIYHIKHHKSFLQILGDPRFEIIVSSKEKFGFCIAKFNPNKVIDTVTSKKTILWLRTDSIGDNILAASMLEPIKNFYKDSNIIVACQRHIAELYENCPYVDNIIALPDGLLFQDKNEYDNLIERIKELKPDILLNSTYSEHELSDLPGLEFIPERYAFRKSSQIEYNRIFHTENCWKTEIDRHRDFLTGLNICVGSLSPVIWMNTQDEKFANEIFEHNALKSNHVIAVCPSARTFHRHYDIPKFAEALNKINKNSDFTFLLIGGSVDFQTNHSLAQNLNCPSINLAGKTSLRQTAAIIKKSRLYIGSETGAAHIACAVGTPNVVILGGGHFGRFMPYSHLSTVVSLPLNCFGCNWQCKYDEIYCIKRISPDIIVKAAKEALKQTTDRPAVFLQNLSPGNYKEQIKPKWEYPVKLLDSEKIKLILEGELFSNNTTGVELPEQCSYSKRSHFADFQKFGKHLSLDTELCDLKAYQDLFVYNFIIKNIPEGSKLLEIGGGNSRIIEELKEKYEIWNLDKLNGNGNGPVTLENTEGFRLIRDYIGCFNKELPESYFDCIFSISTLEHVTEDELTFDNILQDMNRLLKPNGYSVHCFDVILKKDSHWTNKFLPYVFKNIKTLNEFINFADLKRDLDLYKMSEASYKKFWEPFTNKSYQEFGEPVSYNVIWQKKYSEKRITKHFNIRTNTNDDLPVISIVTPSFNQGEYLEECIESILCQNYPKLEYIIMDGGSKDNSVKIIKKYSKHLKFWQSKPDGGQYKAIQAGFERCSGEIMSWLNSDDKLHPNALFKVGKFFKENPSVEWITGRPTFWNKNGELAGIYEEMPEWYHERFLNMMYDNPFIQQESTFWRKSLWEKAGSRFDTELNLAGDLELWMRFFRHSDLTSVDTLLGGWRNHGEQKAVLFLDEYHKEAKKIIHRERELLEDFSKRKNTAKVQQKSHFKLTDYDETINLKTAITKRPWISLENDLIKICGYALGSEKTGLLQFIKNEFEQKNIHEDQNPAVAVDSPVSVSGTLNADFQNKLYQAEEAIKADKLEIALSLLCEILEEKPDNLDALNDMAIVLTLQNDIENAKQTISCVLNIDSGNTVALNNLKYIQENY